VSRLDDEYSPADHHDLDRIDQAPIGSPTAWTAVCACGESLGDQKTRSSAFKAWDGHRQQEWFG
jgi:hypothetical protein